VLKGSCDLGIGRDFNVVSLRGASSGAVCVTMIGSASAPFRSFVDATKIRARRRKADL